MMLEKEAEKKFLSAIGGLTLFVIIAAVAYPTVGKWEIGFSIKFNPAIVMYSLISIPLVWKSIVAAEALRQKKKSRIEKVEEDSEELGAKPKEVNNGTGNWWRKTG